MINSTKRLLPMLLIPALVLRLALIMPLAEASASGWDGTVDISWYDPAATELYISAPAQLAGLAALVNGMTDLSCPKVVGNTSYISCKPYNDVMLVGAGGGNVSDTVYVSSTDFAYKTVYLTADIDMGGVYNSAADTWSGPNWTPIGGRYSMATEVVKGDSLVLDSHFNGVLDGQGHTISNIYCNRFAAKGFPYSQAVGLVGALGGASDLDSTITGTFENGWQPAVKNVVVGKGFIYGRRMVGGIVGRVGTTNNGVIIENCVNHASIRNTDSKGIGGIVGAGSALGVIRSCYNTGSVNTTYACPAGGIVGSNIGMSVYNCYNVGTIDSNNQLRGRGIGGHDSGTYVIDNCYYLEGCDDDPDSKGYYTGSSKKITINIVSLTAAAMKESSFVNLLNSAGEVFVPDTGGINNGYPILFFESAGSSQGSYTITVSQPGSGGTISADYTGSAKMGQTVELTSNASPGYMLKHFTLNGTPLQSSFFTVTGNSVVSAVFSPVTTATLMLPASDKYHLSAIRTGYSLSGNTMDYVVDEPVKSGDTLLEGNIIRIKTYAWEGETLPDMDYEYTSAVSLAVKGADRNTDGTYTVGNEDAFVVEAERTAQLKSWISTADTQWYTARRSEYTLTSGEQLAGLAYLVNVEGITFEGITIYLGNDISLENTDGTIGTRTWAGIGRNTVSCFKGIFDGKGYTISEMSAYNSGSYAGLFGYCSGATIKNIVLRGTSKCTASTAYAAGIAAYASNSVIENCVSYVSVEASGMGAGGIAAYISDGTTVTGCSNRGAIKGTTGVAGIVGISYSTNDTIEQCVNYSDIASTQDGTYGTGGIVGRLAGTVNLCLNSGEIKSADRYTGGIAGYTTAKNYSTIMNSSNTGNITAESAHNNASLGGVAGYAQYLTLDNSKNEGRLTTKSTFTTQNIGEVIGRRDTVTMMDAVNESQFIKPEPDKLSYEKKQSSAPYTVTFIADGNIIKTETYSSPGERVSAPSVPQKSGYTGKWEDYALGAQDLTVKAVYRQKTAGGGDTVTSGGLYFISPNATGVLTVGSNLIVTLDGQNGPFENLHIIVRSGTQLTLRNTNITSVSTILTMAEGTLILEGESIAVTSTDLKENLNPAMQVLGDVSIEGSGSLLVQSGIYNSAIIVSDQTALSLNSGKLTVVKTEMLGVEGGAIHALGATVNITGGELYGYTNSDNIPVIMAQRVNVTGGKVYLQPTQTPRAIQAETINFTGGSMYLNAHSANSDSDDRYYTAGDALSYKSGTISSQLLQPMPFSDVTTRSEHFSGIYEVYSEGYFGGTSGTTFSPDTYMTRAMLVTVLYRMADNPTVTGSSSFTDIKADWYRSAVLWAVKSGITNGTSDTTFSPNDNVTVEQCAVFLARFATLQGQTTTGDGRLIRNVADWAQEAVSWAVSSAILPADCDFAAQAPRSLLAAAVSALS